MIDECDLGGSCVAVKQCVDENWPVDEIKKCTGLSVLKTHGISDAIPI